MLEVFETQSGKETERLNLPEEEITGEGLEEKLVPPNRGLGKGKSIPRNIEGKGVMSIEESKELSVSPL
jgi:hypothetical protein